MVIISFSLKSLSLTDRRTSKRKHGGALPLALGRSGLASPAAHLEWPLPSHTVESPSPSPLSLAVRRLEQKWKRNLAADQQRRASHATIARQQVEMTNTDQLTWVLASCKWLQDPPEAKVTCRFFLQDVHKNSALYAWGHVREAERTPWSLPFKWVFFKFWKGHSGSHYWFITCQGILHSKVRTSESY